MSKLCRHGLRLSKGIRCDHGYIQMFVKDKGRTICKNFGPHTADSQEVAEIYLAQIRKEILQGHIGIKPEIPSKKFSDVARLWFKHWTAERNPDGTVKHNKDTCYKIHCAIENVLIPQFGEMHFDEIRPIDISEWRDTYVAKGLSGTTANRYQATLSSIYSHINMWVKCEKIKPAFKLPCVLIEGKTYTSNPCDAVEMAKASKRTRILTKYEASKLKLAFTTLNDADGWEICKLALKSVLSLGDLKKLDVGSEIDTERSKTGVPVNIPLPVLVKLNWYGWRTRWERARKEAGLVDLQFRDLRKTGINWLKGKFDLKMISEYAGHASIKTTEQSYTIRQSEYLAPLATDLSVQVDSI